MRSLTMVALDPEVIEQEALEPQPDQRQAERQEVSRPAVLTVVGTSGAVLHGEVRNISEGGTQIRLEEPLQPFTLVKIECDDNLLMGEVVYCRPDESAWIIGLRVEHSLFGLKALADAMQGF